VARHIEVFIKETVGQSDFNGERIHGAWVQARRQGAEPRPSDPPFC
jgi:hypothetical protein